MKPFRCWLFVFLVLSVVGAASAAPVDCSAPVEQATGLPGVAPGLEAPAQAAAEDELPVESPDLSEASGLGEVGAPGCDSRSLSCAAVNAGHYSPSVCPTRCVASDGACGFCLSSPLGCLCTE